MPGGLARQAVRWAFAFGLGIALRRVAVQLRQQSRWEKLGAGVRSVGAIPLRGWLHVFGHSFDALIVGDHLSKAAAIAFYALLSLVPAISILVTVYGLFADPARVVGQLGPFLTVLPDAAATLVREQAERISGSPREQLSLTLVLSFLIACWTANSATKALFDTLNRISEVVETRSFLHLNAVSLLTTLSLAILLALLLASLALLPTLSLVAPWLREDWANVAWWRWPLLALVSYGVVRAIYGVGLARTPLKGDWLAPGALLAVALGMALSIGFSAYVSQIASYTATYGSLAAIVIFLTWLWLTALAVILGAQFNASIARLVGRAD